MHDDEHPTVRDGIGHRQPGLVVRDVGEEILILDTGSDQIHQLNVSASLIWRLSNRGMESTDIATALANQFDISHAQAVQDTVTTLAAFRNLGLLAESEVVTTR